MKKTKNSRRIYVIEIMPQWYPEVAEELPEGKGCFYVGETGKTRKERYWEHKTGKIKRGRRPKRTSLFAKMRKSQGGEVLKNKVDLKLRRTMSAGYPEVSNQKASEALEAKVIDSLRSQGHAVYPKGPGEIPFEDCRAGS